MIFRDRADAGRKLANVLRRYRGRNVIVYALPRGGVVLGVQVAELLGAPLDLIIVRKIGHPANPEFAIAAVADDGHIEKNEAETQAVDRRWFNDACRIQQAEACRRRDLYLAGRTPVKADGKIAVLVDDGLATGLTMALAIREVRERHASKVIVAVPVAPPETVEELRDLVDDIVVLDTPPEFVAIGAFYLDFPQLTDEEVVNLMNSRSALEA
jgi:predicted phosphoribosyltransferase